MSRLKPHWVELSYRVINCSLNLSRFDEWKPVQTSTFSFSLLLRIPVLVMSSRLRFLGSGFPWNPLFIMGGFPPLGYIELDLAFGRMRNAHSGPDRFFSRSELTCASEPF